MQERTITKRHVFVGKGTLFIFFLIANNANLDELVAYCLGKTNDILKTF